MRPLALRDLGKRVYSSVPACVQELLISGYFYGKSRRVYGREFQRSLEFLEKTQWLDVGKLIEIQCGELERIVDAAKHTPYYRRLFRDRGIDSPQLRGPGDLAVLPILDKETVRQRGEQFVDERLDPRRLYSTLTSGSSGTPLRIYQTRSFEPMEEAFIVRQWGWAGVSPTERRVKIRGDLLLPASMDSARPWRRNFASRELRMSAYHLSPSTARAYVERIQRFRPRALIAYPSSASILASLARESALCLEVPLVFTSSETLSPAQRRLIEATFGARVFDHYGMTESVVAIQECERGTYHVIPEYGITELLPMSDDPSGELREVVSTGLINQAMPLLRYRTGDIVRVKGGDQGCTCGRAFPAVREILGRQEDIVQAASGAWVGRLNFVFGGLSGVVEAQIEQELNHDLIVRVVRGIGYGQKTEVEIRRNLLERVGDLRVSIEYVEGIPRGPNGKIRAVISHVGRAPTGCE